MAKQWNDGNGEIMNENANINNNNNGNGDKIMKIAKIIWKYENRRNEKKNNKISKMAAAWLGVK